MTIILPTGGVADWMLEPTPRPARNASAFGTNLQGLTRIGRKFAATVTLHKMTAAAAAAWSDLDEETDVLAWPIDQGALNLSEGTPVVDGGSQTGSELDIRGATAGLVIPKGWYLSAITSSRRFVYQTRAAVTVIGDGTATLPIRPLIRWGHADGDTIELAAAKIEGLVSWPGMTRQSLNNRLAMGARFVLEERA